MSWNRSIRIGWPNVYSRSRTMSSPAEEILSALEGLPWWGKWIATIAISMLPIVELRGALPAAVKVFGLGWGLSYVLSLIGNMVPVPFLLLFYPAVERFLMRFGPFRRFFGWLHERTRRKGYRKVKLWGEVGLILFVAIPLPVTGAWTGTLVSYLFGLDKLKAFLAILAGVLIAGLIMMAVTFFHPLVGLVIIIALALALFAMGKVEEHLMPE